VLFTLKLLAGGIKSYAPSTYRGTGGSNSARYCYSAWLRHFTLIRDAGFAEPLGSIVELGPGDSIGLGLAALLSGSHRYIALDVVEHANRETNLAIFDELVDLFQRREPIPSDGEFAGVYPALPDYSFPFRYFSEGSLHPDRLTRIRSAIENPHQSEIIRYVCPWYEASLLEPASVDLIVSQATLQEVEDLPRAYDIMTRWLKPGGIMSHQIDFSFLGVDTYFWNQHWGYPELLWKIIRGKRPYYFNRVPFSQYIELTKRYGHAIRQVLPVQGRRPGLPPSRVARRFRSLSGTDFATSSAYILSTV